MKPKIIGIYKITNPKKKVYIGQALDINKRWRVYRSLHCKDQTKLYRSFLKYGVENHKFEIIHQSEPEQLDELETYYIDLFQCFNSKYGLNLRAGGGNKGRHSDETKIKIGLAHKGKKLSEETKRKLSEYKGEKSYNFGKPMSEEQKYKIAEAQKGEKAWMYGKKHSEETRRKMSEAGKGEKCYWFGKPRSEETKRKLSEANRGKTHSEETRKKMSEAGKGRVASEETKQKMRKPKSEEAKRKMSEWRIGTKLSPETIAKRQETRRRNREQRLINDVLIIK